MLKIPVEGGVITLKSSKLVLLECAMVFGPRETPSVAKPIIEERVKVAINPEYPEQTVMIGSTLTKGGHNKLCGLLQRNLDIFAWKPTDMTDVLRHIAEHHLNVQEGCSLVRQKKRGQAADRNQAIQKEVGKLVGARIMREVHYHDWLSNPVMVKKHDGSWRMCVDFKDLNKACPKDEAFKQMKQLIAELPLPTAPMEKEELIVYLAAAKETVTAVLMTKREAKKIPIYFVSRALKLSELNYTSMEKLVLALVHASKRLKRPRVSVKGQILADFIFQRPEEDSPDTPMEEEGELPEPCILFTDGSSCTDGSGVGLILTNPEGMEFTYALRFRFVLPGEIISNNGKQFRDDPFKDWCEKLCIRQHFASIKHPQTNGLVERANRSLGEGIKARLDARSKNWIEELPYVLWAHSTMIKSSTEDTPLSLTYRTEAVILAEIGMPTRKTSEVDLVGNNEALEINLDLLEERREEASIRKAKSKAKMEKYYNSKVRNTSFKPGDLVYHNNDASW
nr:reverse transcriptase domain-containing protein [Tanacetum cinerariifolium]